MCSPTDPAADASGCVSRPVAESAYCGDDGDPCTIDVCRSGACRHENDGTGTRCADLLTPYRAAVDLLAHAQSMEVVLTAAIASGCAQASGKPACDVAPGEESARLVALLQAAERDLRTATLALAGRLTEPTSGNAARDPLERARLALGLLAGTPQETRDFLATLAQARARRHAAPAFARSRRGEARRLLRGTLKLRRQLQRLLVRRQSFTP